MKTEPTRPYTVRIQKNLIEAAEKKEDVKILRRRIALLVEKFLTDKFKK